MPAINVAKLYAMAGEDAGQLTEELFNFNEILQKDFSIKLFFENDCIDKEQRKEYFDELCPHTSGIFKDFVHLMIDQGLVRRIAHVAMRCIRLSEAKKHARYAHLESAFPLDEEFIEKIKCAFGKNLFFAKKIKPELIGGFKLRFLDGEVLDASIAGKLAQLRGEMVK
ncbi:MAG: F0F1 ATP synthase subunit delta [Candidatus Margulisbacteria bacterium]|nr:F0F1 ATP synthase subunit delta [Candidatus Margulisiibacteriota bacterium]